MDLFMQPHMDLVTQIKYIPTQDHYFVSIARKDNFCYLWDQRNLSQYVTYFEHFRHGNQRTGLDVTPDGSQLFLGQENG